MFILIFSVHIFRAALYYLVFVLHKDVLTADPLDWVFVPSNPIHSLGLGISLDTTRVKHYRQRKVLQH
jgi:hypothetical protein